MPSLAVPVLWKITHDLEVKGLVDLQMSDLPLNARVSDLFPVLKSKINATLQTKEQCVRDVGSIFLYGIPLIPNRPLEPLVLKLRVAPRFLASVRICPITKDGPKISITVKTLTGKNLFFRCDPWDTVTHLKYQVEEVDGIPFDQQCMIYAGRQLENDRTL